MATNQSRRPRARRGFTLVEVMAVVAIMGVLSGFSVSKVRRMADLAREARAIEEIRLISLELSALDTLPASLAAIHRDDLLDPWGHKYVYLLFPRPSTDGHHNPPPAGARKDRFLVPINSRYDLYSMGADGKTSAPLTAAQSRDDIIYANDGGYIGRASGY